MGNFTIIFHHAAETGISDPGKAIWVNDATGSIVLVSTHAAALAALATVPVTNPITFHAIGGGQAGFDGIQLPAEAATPGGLGGEGASWATVIVNPGAYTIQIGNQGLANGAAGTDTWVKDSGLVTVLQARGGGSVAANIGDSSHIGGLGNLARDTSNATYPSGMGGNGGGGAGGPDGAGGDTGNVSPKQVRRTNPAITTSNGGLGGGAGNGGKPGFKLSFLGTNHRSNYSTPNPTIEFVPGDGGDALNPLVFFSGSATLATDGRVIGVNESGTWGGAGGPGGATINTAVGASNYVNRNGWAASFPFLINTEGMLSFFAQTGGPGALWGQIPANWATDPVPTFFNGGVAGPGGGGGGGGGGAWNRVVASQEKRGRIGGPYGGGGGGGGNWVIGFTADGTGGPGYWGVLVARFNDTPPTPPAPLPVHVEIFPPVPLPPRYGIFGPEGKGNR